MNPNPGRISKLWVVLLLFTSLPLLAGQLPESTGLPYFKNFNPIDYNGQPQNWSLVQDRQGLVYVANQGGVMEYDGVSWRFIRIPHKSARSLAIDKNNRIFVGGNNQLGVLEAGKEGKLVFVSLLDALPEKYRNFAYVWRIHIVDDTVWFCTSSFLLRWDYKQFTVIEPGKSMAPPFLCGGILYTRVAGKGLMKVNGNSLQLCRGGQEFSSKKIYMMSETAPGEIMIGTHVNGFYRYSGGKAVPFTSPTLQQVTAHRLVFGTRLSNGHLALGTLSGGLYITDTGGNLKLHIDKKKGLQDNTVWFLMEDRQKDVWLGLNQGITHLETSLPFRIFNEKAGLSGLVLSITRMSGHLYAGTNNGLYRRLPGQGFQAVPGISGNCYHLLARKKNLLAATDNGLYLLNSTTNTPKKILDDICYTLVPSSKQNRRIWVGTTNGPVSLRLYQAEWQKEYRWPLLKREVRTMVEEGKNLWLGGPAGELLKVTFPHGVSGAAPGVIDYKSVLPPGNLRVFTAAGGTRFATESGLFRFHSSEKKFLPDMLLGKEFRGSETGRSVFLLVQDFKKNIWFLSRKRIYHAIRQADGEYRIRHNIFKRIPLTHVDDIYVEDEITWFATAEGLLAYRTAAGQKAAEKKSLPFKTLIRALWSNGKALPIANAAGTGLTVIPFERRNLRFEVAAPFFQAKEQTRYRYKLEGYDNRWSDWSNENRKDYTNLETGFNRFHVQARNIYGDISKEARFHFRVPAPWYRSWWAYTLYILATASLFFLLLTLRSRQLVREKQRLEVIIGDRTREIRMKNQQLEEMAGIKSRFFANISHEFRTPLTLIMGPLEQLVEKNGENTFKMMLRNAQRLLGLINQLLELSRFESATIRLQASCQPFLPFIKGIVATFKIPAQQQDLQLQLETDQQEIQLWFDARKLEEVFYNLLINAVKFTPRGGRITITVKRSESMLKVSVQDTGPGIAPEQLNRIFDRFYQTDTIYENKQKGSGIGLAIAKEMVLLHQGTLTVTSQQGEHSGTCFTVSLLLGRSHLQDKQIVEQSKPPTFQPPPLPVPDQIEQPIAEPDFSEPGAADKAIILVVEDSVDVCKYISTALVDDYTVVTAGDGTDGLEKAKLLVPDLIISDIMMPGMDGYQLTRALKTNVTTSHIPIILLTAKASEENIIEGLDTGVDDYITKPFNTRLLTRRIKNLIDIRAQLQRNHHREMTLRPVKTTISGIDKEFLKDLQAAIRLNIGDPEFNVEELARRLYMSGATLYRKIRALSGESPTEYIRSYRLKQAAQLLRNSQVSVTEAAFEVGFTSRAYFTRCFKEKFQQLPSVYKDSH